MANRPKMIIRRFIVIFFGLVLLAFLLGFIFFPRPDLPALVDEDPCSRYNIHLDGTSIESIYLTPETILVDPEAFLRGDPAYLLLGEHRARIADPLPMQKWLNQINRLANQPLSKREQRPPYRLYELIMAHKNSFCQEVSSSVLAYLPAEADAEVTIYLTALEGSAVAFAREHAIAFSLSHPLFANAQLIHEPTGLSTFYNQALHELFHIYYSDVHEYPPLEELMANEIVIDMVIGLHNEGIATYISYELNEQYPAPFEYYMYAVDQEWLVGLYINKMNDLFAIARTKPTGDAYNDTYRQITALGYRKNGFYIVGAFMAKTIEEELGRDVLAQTISGDVYDFVRVYNTVAKEDMQIAWSDPPN